MNDHLRLDPFRKILWFADRGTFHIEDFFDLLGPCRTVSDHPRYKSGVFASLKCQRDVQYESALELAFIQRMENDKRVRFYWEQPVQVPYWRGRRKCYYTPDFGIYLTSGRIVIAEVKDLPGMLDHRVQIKAEGLMEFCSRRGFGLLLTDGRHTPSKLTKGRVNRILERELLTALESGPVREPVWREIKARCGATPTELYRAIIRHDLKFYSRRFKLTQGKQSQIFRQVYFGKKKYEELTADRFTTLNLSHSTRNG